MWKSEKKNSNLIFTFAAGLLLCGLLLTVIFLTSRKSGDLHPPANLGEQWRQQANSAVLQLANSLFGNTNNLNQLTKKPDGTGKTIQEIEEEFLIGAFNPNQSGISVSKTIPSEVIERVWWELRPWIEGYLKDLNKPILEHAREKFCRDVENWLRWQQPEYNRQLEEYQKHLRELKKIEDLIAWYQKIREQELLDKISRKTELIGKGYADRDIEKLKEWDLLDQKEIPDLTAEGRIGATNILWTLGGEIGGSSDLIIFLKPNSGKTAVNFSIELHEEKEDYKKFIQDFLIEKGKFNYEAYVLIRTDFSGMRGPSAGIAYYLALYSLVNHTPLPRNLGSTGTVFKKPKVGAIGGLNLKLEYNVKKERPINIFILSEENKKYEGVPSQSYEDIASHITSKIKQVHFVSQVNQIELALQEILKEPSRKIVRSYDDKSREPPERPTELEITFEQLLSLVVEYYSKEGQTAEEKDFRSKLLAAGFTYSNYQEAIGKAVILREEYQKKIKQGGGPTELTELISLKDKTKDVFRKLEKMCENGFKLLVSVEELNELASLIGQNKWLTKKHNQIIRWLLQQDGLAIIRTAGDPNSHIAKAYQGSKFLGLEGDDNWYDTIERYFREAELEIKKQGGEGIEQDGMTEEKKKKLLQEYQNRFQNISSSVDNLTNEILTNLSNVGYTIEKIEWTGELKAPSLSTEPAISCLFSKKK